MFNLKREEEFINSQGMTDERLSPIHTPLLNLAITKVQYSNAATIKLILARMQTEYFKCEQSPQVFLTHGPDDFADYTISIMHLYTLTTPNKPLLTAIISLCSSFILVFSSSLHRLLYSHCISDSKAKIASSDNPYLDNLTLDNYIAIANSCDKFTDKLNEILTKGEEIGLGSIQELARRMLTLKAEKRFKECASMALTKVENLIRNIVLTKYQTLVGNFDDLDLVVVFYFRDHF